MASLKTGKTRRLTPRGRFVSWLPGGNDLIVITSHDRKMRYYRIDVPHAEEF
ncbi:hypothetical protein D3C78_1933630 [compost metagenome]